MQELEMNQSILDPCLSYRKINNQVIGIVGTLVDNTLAAGNEQLLTEEEEKSKTFDVKPCDGKNPFQIRRPNVELNTRCHKSQSNEPC